MYMKYKTKFVHEGYWLSREGYVLNPIPYTLADWMQYIETLLEDKSSFVHKYNLSKIANEKYLLDQFCKNINEKHRIFNMYFDIFQYLESVKKIYSLEMFELEMRSEPNKKNC